MATARRRRTLREYVEALEEERRKMVVFHRELPYSLDLVSRALESYRLQLEVAEEEGEEEEGPVLKEFIPTKREESKESKEEEEREKEEEERSRKLPEWLRVAKVTDPQRESPSRSPSPSPSPTPPKEEGKAAKTVAAAEAKKASTATSTAEAGGGGRGRGGGEEKGVPRKARRCWSPELHHRFLHALQQLGGSHAATPKQIRELMKVDGLTNDEVKSHLQKYRLHTRRGNPPEQASNSSSNTQTSQPQIVFIGSMWAPPLRPLDPSALPVGAARTEQSGHPQNRVYAPIATIPLKQEQQQNRRQKVITCMEQKVDGGGGNSDSSATTMTTSSHTITTTESPLN